MRIEARREWAQPARGTPLYRTLRDHVRAHSAVEEGMMDDLVTWLRAQLDEDERVAQGTGVLGWLTYRNPNGSMRYTRAASQAEDGTWIVDGQAADYSHSSAVVVYDWRQVLREVEAKRRIIDWCESMHPYDVLGGLLAGEARRVLGWLGSVYSDRPGYRDEWRP